MTPRQRAVPKCGRGRKCDYVNMQQNYFSTYLIFLILLHLTNSVISWDSEDLELFDLVEEVNQNFYDVLGVSQVSCER